MKIGNPADKRDVKATGAAPAKAAESGVAPKAQITPDPSAKVQFSNSAASLLSGGTTADFDADKVARISQAIEDGTFKINAEVIADKLIANAQEALGKVQR